jgi:hypothetical protein
LYFITADVDIENLEKALSLADNQIIDLEAKAQNLNDEKNRYKDKVDVSRNFWFYFLLYSFVYLFCMHHNMFSPKKKNLQFVVL